MQPDPRLFQSSGLNDQFNGNNQLTFADYLQQTQAMLTRARVDLTPLMADKILQANSPFEWRPTSTPVNGKRGALLIHGLYDSPFTLRDVGRHLQSQGFLVRSVLLPGHATVPGDLLNVQYSEWIKTVWYGVDSLATEVDQIFLVGYSMGAALATWQACYDARISGLVLLSPALRLIHHWPLAFHIHWGKWTRNILPSNAWYKQRDYQRDYTKYESFTYNAATQIYYLLQQLRHIVSTQSLSVPLFVSASAQDDTVCPEPILDWFSQQPNSHNRAVIYSRYPLNHNDSRIVVKNSYLPEQKILDFSHICLSVSPENTHYGSAGDYKDFLRYPDNKPPMGSEVFLGATTRDNLKRHVIQRLTYNPDFTGLMQDMDEFFQHLNLG